jgi:cytidylate kinase
VIVAVDGPAASGKGTLSRRVAAHYGLAWLDTGALYRAVARDALARSVDLDDSEALGAVAAALDLASLGDAALRAPAIGEAASRVARHAPVRGALLDCQRGFAAQGPGAVLDGRDIGTVVCPDADVKLFVTATAEVRARRRWLELRNSGAEVAEDDVLADIRRRDARDAGRDAAPLRRADDAYLLDTTKLDIEAAFKAAVDLIDAATRR